MTATYLGLPRDVWQAVSLLTSFPVVTLLTVGLLASTYSSDPFLDAALYAGYFILLPGLVAAYFWKKGWISDIEVHDRQERNSVFLAALAFSMLGTGMLQQFGAPTPLIKVALVQLLVLSVLYPVNLVWKISVHTSSWGAMMTVLYLLYGAPALLLIPFAVPMTLSRFALEAHTRSQVAAGFSLGVGAAALIFLV
ncbi:MAG: phosphatase PAP2 family protein [Candidatus Nanohaloarchaea archaeon]|nr:phosphatase PAP2 family protein [Candidatus Nanohaloarchaea archaeon]